MARKILLADDSVTAQNMGRKILADAGYDVVTVNNGSAALKRIAEIKPDLIVLDVYMPGYSGLEVCQRLKDSADTAHIPVLLTVGKLEPFKPDEARRVKADAHIVKPFEASELLTAITRLEDRMVPQQSEGSRFSSSSSGVERFGNDGGGKKTEAAGETDTGWKSRLRFPSKKKKEEAEPEEVAVDTNFGDTRKGKSKAGSFSIKPPAPAGQEPGLVPDIPRDITPEELDALSALVAKLDEPVEAVAAAVSEIEASKHAAEIVLAARQIDHPKSDDSTEKSSPVAAAVTSPQVFAVEGKSEIEVPVERVEPVSATFADNQNSNREDSETDKSADGASASAISLPTVDTALLAEAAAPVERNDEPIFALSPMVVTPTEVKAEEEIKLEGSKSEPESESKIDATNIAAVSKIDASEIDATEKIAASEATESKTLETQAEPKGEAASEESISTQIQPTPVVAAAIPDSKAIDEIAPSDAELAEALRLLTPETGAVDGSTIPSHGTLVAAGQLLAEEAARNASGPRGWIAEAVALSPQDAALSLEDEMFRSFATIPPTHATTTNAVPTAALTTMAPISATTFATDPASASVIASAAAAVFSTEIEAGRIHGVSAIAAAVENRLAEAAKAANSRVDTEQIAQRSPETPEASTISSSGEVETARSEVEKEANKTESEPTPEQSASAISSDGIGRDAVDKEAVKSDEVAASEPDKAVSDPATVASPTSANAEEDQNSSVDSGGDESMGKSTWHQIRKTPSGAAATSNLVETAKQEAANQGAANQGAEEAPKAMAAAASAEGASSSSSFASATDSSAIASIVDSVMADLRPKIVEEIAKKLAGK